MHENHSFEYAVIRVVPRVEREEFLNVGVIVYCAAQKYLRMTWKLDEERIKLFCDDVDIPDITENLAAFEKICMGTHESGPIGRLGLAERFRWLTAMRSTIVQTSRVHPGLCTDPAETLARLHTQMVC